MSLASCRLVDIVFPNDTNHHGALFGGAGLSHLDKIAFVASTRALRTPVMMASSEQVSFAAPIDAGDIVELVACVRDVRASAAVIGVELWAENVISGERCRSAQGDFRMRVLESHERSAAA